MHTMSKPNDERHIHINTDTNALAEDLALFVGTKLGEALFTKKHSTLVVSGGTTPRPFFRQLSTLTLDWEQVTVTLADERAVGEQDNQSNAAFIKDNLLIGRAAAAQFIPLFNDGDDAPSAAEKNAHLLAQLPTYDVVVLGMGHDGHTASIFPQSPQRDNALAADQDLAALWADPVTATPMRITQTANRLLNADQIVLHITGQEKATLLERILTKPDPKQWPISHFLTQTRVPVAIFSDHTVPPSNT